MCFLFFYSTFSLLSIFYSTLSLSFHRFNPCSLSLSFFFRSNSLTLTDPSRIKPLPSRLVWRLHCHRSEVTIAATDLKLANLKLHLPPHFRRWWLVEFGHWLIYWVGVLLKILSFYLFIYLLRFLDLKFVGGSSNCGCSLSRWLLLWRWFLVLGWWWLPLGCAFVYLLGFE